MPHDRTYCMNCGVTLGVRCPECRTISPVGSKVCVGCGHSFVQKKKRLQLPFWKYLKKYPRPILGVGLMLVLLAALILAAQPSVVLRQLHLETELSALSISGYELMHYFLSGDPVSITSLLSLRALEDAVPTIKALLFGLGVSWLCFLCGLFFAVCLMACNYKRMGKPTARRLFAPLGVSLGGAALLGGLSPVLNILVTDAMMADVRVEGIAYRTFSIIPFVVLGCMAVLFLLQTILYVGIFRHSESDAEEISISHILYIPLALAGRGIRKFFRRIRRKRSGRSYVERDEPTFTVTPRFTTYLILFGASLVFTQALLSKISHIFFWFVFLLPVVLIVYVLLARHALSVDMISETVTTQKNTPYTYEFRIDNRSILALPFIEALVCLPQSNSVRCTERVVRLSMAPLSAYHMKNTVSFRFRGTYDIGVRCFYIYDFFRIFRARVDVESVSTVYVLPRRLSLDETLAQAVSDSTVRTVRSPLVVDKLEVSDIRDYQNGDSLKSIHWKLSSKAENFVVKDYNTGTSNQTVVFCDLAPHFPDEPPKTIELSDISAAVPTTATERRAHKKAMREEQDRRNADLKAKSKRVRKNSAVQDISDEALRERLEQRAAVTAFTGKDTAPTGSTDPQCNDSQPASPTGSETEPVLTRTADVHELARPTFYDDMNEYLADGVVELTIAMVLAELRQGHEVLLLWFDRRSDTGVFAYPLRGIDEFETIYHLFATAPLCESDGTGKVTDCDVTALTAMVSHLQSIKQLFVIPSLDTAMLNGLISLPSVTDAGNAGSTEVVLYSPEERFKYPLERSSYLEGCREQLASHGISLTAGSFGVTNAAAESVIESIAHPIEGGTQHETA